jgi:uncharacterized SAM-binding protein YcdF (DUF218 family)
MVLSTNGTQIHRCYFTRAELIRSLNAPVEIAGTTVRRSAVVMLLVAGLGVGTWVERDPLRRGAAELWGVSDTVTHADAIVVLGGGLDVRPFAAAVLYKKGLADKVLISQVKDDRVAAVGAALGHTEAIRRVLLSQGVPPSAIETFGSANLNTVDEARALRKWVEYHSASVVIIPTEIFTARRVRWVFRRELAGQAVRVEVPSFEPPQYTQTDWWKAEQGIVAFQNEVLKYIYYRLKY